MVREAGATFSADALPHAPTPVLFTAEWCGYCRRFEPLFEELDGGVVVDVSDESAPVWERYGIRVVPTVLLFAEGRPVKRWEGALTGRDAESIAAALAQA